LVSLELDEFLKMGAQLEGVDRTTLGDLRSVYQGLAIDLVALPLLVGLGT
jgi:hypothetical protein